MNASLWAVVARFWLHREGLGHSLRETTKWLNNRKSISPPTPRIFTLNTLKVQSFTNTNGVELCLITRFSKLIISVVRLFSQRSSATPFVLVPILYHNSTSLSGNCTIPFTVGIVTPRLSHSLSSKKSLLKDTLPLVAFKFVTQSSSVEWGY